MVASRIRTLGRAGPGRRSSTVPTAPARPSSPTTSLHCSQVQCSRLPCPTTSTPSAGLPACARVARVPPSGSAAPTMPPYVVSCSTRGGAALPPSPGPRRPRVEQLATYGGIVEAALQTVAPVRPSACRWAADGGVVEARPHGRAAVERGRRRRRSCRRRGRRRRRPGPASRASGSGKRPRAGGRVRSGVRGLLVVAAPPLVVQPDLVTAKPAGRVVHRPDRASPGSRGTPRR